MSAPTRCQPTTWATELSNPRADNDADLDWLIDRPVSRARDLRYQPDDMPDAGDVALVDLVLGVECLPVRHSPRIGSRDERLRTHWTRILSQDLDANDEDYAPDAWKIVGKAALALLAAYVVVYLMVVAVVYLARVPDATSALIPEVPSSPAPTRSGVPIDRPTVARAS
ncbi:MAG TPA: hypothetical protein VGL52_08470 [Casimicrobiaceae bacterium]|jgi:hypothetical protein|nr:hypothetical protein [Casimicrobiaceae bacterium]HET9749314.1 hypothetical protein [Casimicrobiaceae bacterium]